MGLKIYYSNTTVKCLFDNYFKNRGGEDIFLWHSRGRTSAFILLDSGTSKVKNVLVRQNIKTTQI